MQHLPYEECRQLERTHVCAVCNGGLVTVWDGKAEAWAIRCSEGRDHSGFERMIGFREARQIGLPIPLEVEQQFQRKEAREMTERGGQKTGSVPDLVPVIDAGSGNALVESQRNMLIAVAEELDLKPHLGHVVLYYGKPYVTEAGLLYHAHRSGKLDGIQSRPLKEEERRDMRIADEEHAWIAHVDVKGIEQPFTGIGRAREDEKHPVARGSAVEPQHPHRMAEKRAEMQALKKAFPIGLPVLGEEEEREAASA